MVRELRLPPTQADFDTRALPVSDLRGRSGQPWFRLHRVEYANRFYPSKGSRLTPISGDFPCVYLAASLETTVAEVWGDRFAALREAGGTVHVISRSQAEKWTYLEAGPLPAELRVCDLTDADTRLAAGLDSGTLYAIDLEVPQAWAECMARHPLQFDGIRYRSRHTDEDCLVLWTRPERRPALDETLSFRPAGAFLNSDAAFILAGKIGVRLSFAW